MVYRVSNGDQDLIDNISGVMDTYCSDEQISSFKAKREFVELDIKPL